MTQDVNILIRGQSNAELFVAYGGGAKLESQLEAKLGDVNVNILARYDDPNSTIYSATAFLNWDTDGEEQGLLNFVRSQPATIRADPTITLWMHNEYDSNTVGITTGQWVSEVRADATQVRAALGQGAGTTPYFFTYVPYDQTQPGSVAAIQAGMNQLAADASFNARFDTTAMNGLAMDNDGYQNGSHMGYADVQLVANRLSSDMAGLVSTLGHAGGTSGTPPVSTTIGSGADSLVLKISQDAWQGSAQYTVSVDGKQVGSTLTATALHGTGQDDILTVLGSWASGSHKVTVSFLNDAWGGTPDTDRNLYVDGITHHGTAVPGGTAAMFSAGPVDFIFS